MQRANNSIIPALVIGLIFAVGLVLVANLTLIISAGRLVYILIALLVSVGVGILSAFKLVANLQANKQIQSCACPNLVNFFIISFIALVLLIISLGISFVELTALLSVFLAVTAFFAASSIALLFFIYLCLINANCNRCNCQ